MYLLRAVIGSVTALFVSLLIGYTDYFRFGFRTLNWKMFFSIRYLEQSKLVLNRIGFLPKMNTAFPILQTTLPSHRLITKAIYQCLTYLIQTYLSISENVLSISVKDLYKIKLFSLPLCWKVWGLSYPKLLQAAREAWSKNI